MRIPARYAVHAVLLVVAGAVAFQNVTNTSLEAAFKSSDRLARFFNFNDESIITEGLETLPKATGGNGYLQAGIELPNLALATEELATSGLISTEQELPVTDTDALAKPSMSLTTIAERPREEIVKYSVQPGDTVSTIAEEFGLATATVLIENNLSVTSVIKPDVQLSILPVDGITHVVKEGDTLQAVAKKYQASLDKIVSFNKLPNAESIKEGQKLIVPGGRRPAPPKPKPSAGVRLASSSGGGFGPQSGTGDGRSTGSLQWPIGCRTITQYFGWHTGIDIACSFGTPLYAADGGVVASAGWNGGYGYEVVVRHGGCLSTRYAHIKEGGIAVRVGQQVSQGQIVGYEGSTGWSTGPHIHFEVMCNGAVQNPLNYL